MTLYGSYEAKAAYIRGRRARRRAWFRRLVLGFAFLTFFVMVLLAIAPYVPNL